MTGPLPRSIVRGRRVVVVLLAASALAGVASMVVLVIAFAPALVGLLAR